MTGIIFAIYLLLSLCTSKQTYSQTNLITNSGFESGLTGWTVWGANMSLSSESHQGSYAVKISNRKNPWDALVRNVSPLIENGKTYRLSCYARLADKNSGFWATLALNAGGTTTYTNFLSAEETVTSNYILYSGTINPKWTGTLNSANIYFETNKVGTIFPDYWIDDVVLIEEKPDTGTFPLVPGLKDIKGQMLIGGCVTDGSRTYFNSAKAKSIVLSDCNTVNVQCYPAWGRWDENNRHVYHTGIFDSQVKEMKEQKMTVTAHMLLGWDQYFPDWFRLNDFQPDTLEAIMKSWLSHIITSNGNDTLVDIWNVVNEAISWDGKGGYWPLSHVDKKSACEFQRMGMETDASGLSGKQLVNTSHPVYIRKAFEYARTLTDSRLELRDASMEFPTDSKYHAFYQLVRHLKNMGTPVDVIGFQCHLDIDRIYDWDGLIKNIRRYKDLGYEVNIAEVDIGDVAKSWSEEKSLLQKMMYYRLTTSAIKAGVNDFQTWGYFDDNNTGWRYGQKAFPYNNRMEKKPAWEGMREAITDLSHILWWEMDSTANNLMPDVMQNNNHGTCMNITTSIHDNGFRNKALVFDGMDDYIQSGTLSPLLAGKFNLSFFIKTNASKYSVLAEMKDDLENSIRITLNENGTISIESPSAIPACELASDLPLNDNQWHFISLSCDSLMYRLFIDGSSPVDSCQGNPLNISRLSAGASSTGLHPFHGMMDELKLYDYEVEHGSLQRNLIPFRPLKPIAVQQKMIVKLSWNDQSNNEDGYIIERKDPGNAGFSEIGRITDGKLSYTDTLDIYSSTYTYRILTFNRFGNSEPSTSVSITTPADPLTSVPELSDQDDLPGILLYPNPANNQVTINARPGASFTLSDIRGRILISKTNLPGREDICLDLFASGIYIVRLKENDKVFTTKLIKN